MENGDKELLGLKEKNKPQTLHYYVTAFSK